MKEGVEIEAAAIEAGERRLRPIFLTTMAAAVGVTPMILSGSTMWSPLGSAIAFGLVGSMFFTLIVIPVLYVTIHQRRSASGSKLGPVAALIVLAIASGTVAQAQPRALTLDEAVTLATQHNSTVKIAGEKVQQMDARVKEARANYFPSLTNDTNAGHMAERQYLDIPAGSLGVYPATGPIPATTEAISQGKSDLLLSTTTLSQPLTQYFKSRAGVDVARADAAGARADVRRTENEVANKVKQVFYAILTTQRRRDALDSQIRAAELRIVETRNAVDTGVTLEVRAAEVRAQIAQAKHTRGQLQDAVIDLQTEFADLLGLPLDTEFTLMRPVDSDSDVSLEPAAAVESAMARNPEIELATHQVEKARAGVRAAHAEYIPDISAYAQYIHQNGVPFLSVNNGVFGLRMTWTAFEFGKRRGQVQERNAEVAQAEENLTHLKNRVQIDVEKAVRKLNRTETGVSAAKEVLAETVEARRVSADQVQAGTANHSVLLEAEAAVSSAEADLLRAEYDRSVASAELARLMGTR
jgi:outer membrane protein TolC